MYRQPATTDLAGYSAASRLLSEKVPQWAFNLSALPQEPISKQQPRVLFVLLYGLTKWASLFNDRQALAIVTHGEWILRGKRRSSRNSRNGLCKGVSRVLALCLTSISHYLCTSATWLSEGLISSFILGGNIPMKWDYAEGSPFGHLVGTWNQAISKVDAVFADLAAYPASSPLLQTRRYPAAVLWRKHPCGGH